MKGTLLVYSLFLGIFVNAQILDYESFGVLLSNENKLTTARTMGMKSAFGALGGDLSTFGVNPAGAAIFSHSAASISLANNHTDLSSEFYGTTTQNSHNDFDLAQVGGLLLFRNDVDDSKLKNIAVGVNVYTVNSFDNDWGASGKATPTWIVNPTDEDITYTHVENQKYYNITSGSHTSVNFTIATQYGKSLYLGASLNTYNVEFLEKSTRKEISSDVAGNTVDAFESFWQEVNGDGFSMGVGLIYKATQNFRLGLSYTSPVWYDLYEENNLYAQSNFEGYYGDFDGYYYVEHSNDEEYYENNNNKVQAYDYRLQTPSKTTASLAYVFGSKGLLSADFLVKDFKGIRFRPKSEFPFENDDIKKYLTTTYRLNIGTEWRLKKLSLRGGYSYELNPYVDAIDTDNLRGYAMGIGYDFGDYVLDLAYDYSEQTEYFNFYSDFDHINGAELSKNNDKIIATLVYKF